MRRALRDAVVEVINSSDFDKNQLLRIFIRKLRSKCIIWERLPDNYVDKD